MKKSVKQLLAACLMLPALLTLAEAKPVNLQHAEQVARHFWNLHCDKNATPQQSPMTRLDLQWDAFYFFEADNQAGFVIVAADDCVKPILAYSYSGSVNPERLSPELAYWLDGYQQQIDALRADGREASSLAATRWKELSDDSGNPPLPTPLTLVEPLVHTTWDQTSPYNDSCPGNWSKCPTGCVATAMAQVMNFWQYPLQGYGSHTYNSVYGYYRYNNLTANFGDTRYDWANMPNELTRTSSNTEKHAVAQLMYHCGVSVDMMYSLSGSGAYLTSYPLVYEANTLDAMVRYFGYSSNAKGHLRAHLSDSAWYALVMGEIDAQRPIIYAGGDSEEGGHCFVCDGYDQDTLFHFNWGWSGDGDGYFSLENLNVGDGGVGGGSYNFTNAQEIITDLYPHTGNDSLIILRQFPHLIDFETAPALWSGADLDGDGYAWWVADNLHHSGNYSAVCYTTDSRRSSSNDHLYSPLIITPGRYTVSWYARAKNANGSSPFSLSIDTLVLRTDTLASTEWQLYLAEFEVSDGDSIMLDFAYTGSRDAAGFAIDDILIAPYQDPNAIADIETLDSHITLYPNPTTGIVYIATNGNLQRAELLSVTGQQLLSITGNRLDISTLPAGIYLLRLQTTDGIAVRRIVKN